MLHQLLLIHLYRPFLKYTKAKTPLPTHVSPRKICTQAASAISKLLRMYKRTYGLKQICNIAVYIAHTTCTIHLLNLPEKNAQRDVIHGLRNLEEMAEGWLCARRTLRILDISASKWQVELPAEASSIFERTHIKWGSWGSWDQTTSPSTSDDSPVTHALQLSVPSQSRFSPSESHIPPVQRTEPVGPNPVPMVGVSMGAQYPPTPTMAAPIPAMRTARRAPEAQLRPEFVPPEPTYLRPISLLNYPMPTLASSGPSTASPNPNPWYDASGTQIAPQTTSPASGASPVSKFDGSKNLVEESQDWWSRNAAALGIGMENWGGPWSPDLPNQPPHLPYGGSHSHLLSMGEHPGPASVPENQPQVAGGMPCTDSAAANNTPGYNDRWK